MPRSPLVKELVLSFGALRLCGIHRLHVALRPLLLLVGNIVFALLALVLLAFIPFPIFALIPRAGLEFMRLQGALPDGQVSVPGDRVRAQRVLLEEDADHRLHVAAHRVRGQVLQLFEGVQPRVGVPRPDGENPRAGGPPQAGGVVEGAFEHPLQSKRAVLACVGTRGPGGNSTALILARI